MTDFTGKNVLVIGGSRGIGAAIVRRFTHDGAVRDQPIGLALGHSCKLEFGKNHQSYLYKVVYTV